MLQSPSLSLCPSDSSDGKSPLLSASPLSLICGMKLLVTTRCSKESVSSLERAQLHSFSFLDPDLSGGGIKSHRAAGGCVLIHNAMGKQSSTAHAGRVSASCSVPIYFKPICLHIVVWVGGVTRSKIDFFFPLACLWERKEEGGASTG